MGKAGQRRLGKKARFLSTLLVGRPERFRREWEALMDEWVAEAWKRARAMQDGEDEERLRERVFGVLDYVTELLRRCDPAVDAQVGEASRSVLAHECTKAVAWVVEPRLYRINRYKTPNDAGEPVSR